MAPPVHTPLSLRVLVIDDSKVVGPTVERALAGVPESKLLQCTDPTKALAKAIEFGPTVVLLDLHMPELDGLAVASQLRGHQDLAKVPIVVLSTEEKADEKASAFASGADDYLVKWPDEVELVARLRYHSRSYCAMQSLISEQAELEWANRLLSDANQKLDRSKVELVAESSAVSEPRSEDGLESPSAEFGNHQIRVFLVDDSPVVGVVVEGALEGLPGCHFVHCTKPRRALREALEMQPTVILLDLKMPSLSGRTLAERFRQEESLRQVPIIVLTVEQEVEEKLSAFASGAHDYLVKWPHQGELIARIRHHSKLYWNWKQRDEAYQALKLNHSELEWSNKMLTEANQRLKQRDSV